MKNKQLLLILIGLLFLCASLACNKTAPGNNANLNKNTNSNSASKTNQIAKSAVNWPDAEKYKLSYASTKSNADDYLKVALALNIDINEDGEISEKDTDMKFHDAEDAWIKKNPDFKNEVDTQEKAKAYIDAHLPK